jgi:hypothetical protein
MARKKIMVLANAAVIACLLFCVSMGSAQTQSRGAAPKIKPERVLAEYEHAAGLTELAPLQNVHIKARMLPLSPGKVQDFDGVYSADGRRRELTSTREDSLLSFDHSDGFDGKEYWSSDTETRKPSIVFWEKHSEARFRPTPFQSFFFPFDAGWRTNPEHHFSVIGVAMVKDHKAIVVKDERDEFYSTFYYFDAESFLLLRLDSVSQRRTVQKTQGRPYVTTFLFSNYKPMRAIQIPRTIRIDNELEISVDSVELNFKFDEKNYNRP